MVLVMLPACKGATPAGTISPAVTPTVNVQQNTPIDPTNPAPTEPATPTSVPLAAVVNGDEITLAEYQLELMLYEQAKGEELTPEDEAQVLNDLVYQTLLAQSAAEQGFNVGDDLLDERIQILVDQLGSQEALSSWISEHQYNDQSFRRALARSIAAAWMRDQIIEGVPATAEQVHAVQILLYDSDEAADVLTQLQAGNDFGNLAKTYDPITGGDLGWFPRGYLPDATLEEAAFMLEPGNFTPVIETLAGFHILMVLEKDPQHILTPEAHRKMQIQALEDWLEEKFSQSQITILLP